MALPKDVNVYKHKPLRTARSIRIIHLKAASESAEPLQCTLEDVTLEEDEAWPQYTALSYAWEGHERDHMVECDGLALFVTGNCMGALSELRDAEQTIVLWVDAICIDQSVEAVEERNAQVAIMGKIYKNASKVVIWLGVLDDPTKTAISQLKAIIAVEERDRTELNERRRLVQSRNKARVLELSKSKSLSAHARLRKLNSNEEVSRASDDPFGPLFERTWFHRMWTVQEATLALIGKQTLRCGPIEMPWTEFFLAVDALGAAQYRWGRWQEAMSLQKQLSVNLVVHRFPQAKQILDDNPGDLHNDALVYSILNSARNKLASNPKDKIFALYGLFCELNVPINPPDYSKSVSDVYREATIASIEYDKELHVLYFASSEQRQEDLVSWVPDYSSKGWNEGDSRHAQIRGRFAASGPSLPKWRFSDGQRVLVLTGKIKDTVLFRTESVPSVANIVAASRGYASDSPAARQATQENFLETNHRALTVLKSWAEVSQWSDYPTGESSKEVLQRTMVQDYPPANAAAMEDNSFNRWYEIVTEMNLAVQEEHHLENALAALNITSKAIRSFTALQGQAFRFQSEAVAFTGNKCLFYTENGYIGTAPDPLPVSIQAGDVVALVSGLSMPFLLRPVDGGYQLLSHVYVHGMMYGDAWPGIETELDEIHLR